MQMKVLQMDGILKLLCSVKMMSEFFSVWYINEANVFCCAFVKPEKAQKQSQIVFMIHCEFRVSV